ncbi:IS3 family transposase [Belnapia sp. T6]|uniref:IS3 family transposase n=1 Tax=Belnapia mucosa TaxID=2804532 RepID=A0ABS1V967_9PROT|nr:IS3 family transposase [Belnapia mucosa]
MNGTTFSFVSAERANHAVQSRAEAEAELRRQVGRIFAARRWVYGLARVHAELRREGLRHSRRRVERLMRETRLSAGRGRRRTSRTTDSRHELPVAPNLPPELYRDYYVVGPHRNCSLRSAFRSPTHGVENAERQGKRNQEAGLGL